VVPKMAVCFVLLKYSRGIIMLVFNSLLWFESKSFSNSPSFCMGFIIHIPAFLLI